MLEINWPAWFGMASFEVLARLEQKQNYRNVATSVQGGFFLRKNPLDLRGLTLYQFCFCCIVIGLDAILIYRSIAIRSAWRWLDG